MGADGELARQFAITENLDAAGRPIGEARTAKGSFIDARAIIELIEVLQIDGNIAGSMAGVIETAFGNTPNERHLPALEADANGTARARCLAFTAAAAGLAMAAGFALTEAFAAMLRAGTRFKIM